MGSIDISSINRETKQIEEAIKVFTHEAPSRAKQIVKAGDVLVSTVRPNLNAVAHLSKDFEGATASTGFTVLRSDLSKVSDRYLFYWVQTRYFVQEMIRQSTGASYPAVSDTIVKAYTIPLPPLEEQKRIAAILDKADAIRRKRSLAIALTDELLRSTFLDMFGDPVTNPKGWRELELNDILIKIDSGWSPKCDSREADSDEWGMLKLGAITWGHYNSLENKALLPETRPRPELEVKSGDLLFSRKNTYELVGASAYVHTTRAKLLLPDLIFRLCLSENVDPIYVWQTLSRETMRNELSRLASGSSGSMPNISKARLKKLCIPIPPLELQLKYREIVNKFWQYEADLKENQETSDNLFNSLLQKAFRGEL
jgi:type I restriction enzyme, S subunit